MTAGEGAAVGGQDVLTEAERLAESVTAWLIRGGWVDEREDGPQAEALRDNLAVHLSEHVAAAVAREREENARLREREAAVRALRDDWADFEHDAVTCPKYDCGDCTMLNAIHDLDRVLDAPAAAQPERDGGAS